MERKTVTINPCARPQAQHSKRGPTPLQEPLPKGVENINDLWCDSNVLSTKVYVDDLPTLLPKHRIALHDEILQRMTENNAAFKPINNHFRRYGELPGNVDFAWWASFKRHRARLRAFYKALCPYIPDDKVALRNERVEREAERAEALRANRFIKAQAQRSKDNQFIQILRDLLVEEFGEEATEPILRLAGKAAKVMFELNPPAPTN